MTRTQISCWRSRRRDLVKSDLYTESPVINVIGDERAHTRNESSILAVLNNQFDRAVNFFATKRGYTQTTLTSFAHNLANQKCNFLTWTDLAFGFVNKRWVRDQSWEWMKWSLKMKCHHDVEQILSSNTIRNVWKTMCRKCMLILRLKGRVNGGWASGS